MLDGKVTVFGILALGCQQLVFQSLLDVLASVLECVVGVKIREALDDRILKMPVAFVVRDLGVEQLAHARTYLKYYVEYKPTINIWISLPINYKSARK